MSEELKKLIKSNGWEKYTSILEDYTVEELQNAIITETTPFDYFQETASDLKLNSFQIMRWFSELRYDHAIYREIFGKYELIDISYIRNYSNLEEKFIILNFQD